MMIFGDFSTIERRLQNKYILHSFVIAFFRILGLLPHCSVPSLRACRSWRKEERD